MIPHAKTPSVLSVATALLLASPSLAGDVQIDGSYISTAATGTPPLVVSSTTKVDNLNADLLDGLAATDFAAAAHHHDVRYYTQTQLETAGSAMVHWANIVGVPDDGVVTINQEKALAGGVTPGDFPGFPVTLSEPGSYRLTSNLDIRGQTNAENRLVIEITASNVTLDLNGFSLLGPTECSGSPLICSPTGGGDGVRSQSGQSMIAIRNGVIHGMGRHGISCSNMCTVEKVIATQNGSNGVTIANPLGQVHEVISVRNGGEGIRVSGMITRSMARGNGGTGIFTQPGTVASGNLASHNEGNGIRCTRCTLLDNTVHDNGGIGLELENASWGRNLSFNNTLGAVSGTGVQVDTNTCAATLTVSPCP